MLYYRVIKPDRVIRHKGFMQTVANELYTPAEFRKFSTPDKYGCRLRREWLEEVNISRKRTYWFFGARFACEEV